jgi:hypothetical protein
MGRYYIATGTAEYAAKLNVSQLPGVEADLYELRKSLDALGYENALPGLAINPSSEQLSALNDWFQLSVRLREDEVILYYAGHGSVDDRHYLLLASGKEFPAEDLFRAIAAKPTARSILIVLDTCQSGAVGIDIGRIFAPFEERLEQAQAHITILTSSRSRQEAKESTFTPAFAQALRNDNLSLGGLTQPLLHLQDVAKAVRGLLPTWQRTKVVTRPETDTGEVPFYFPNPHFASDLPLDIDLETQRQIIERKTHWDPRSRYFTGRARAIDEIGSWLNQPQSDGDARVITGSPGMGKSALLSFFVVKTPRVQIPIHARGSDLAQLTESLARAAGVPLPPISVTRDEKTRAESVAGEIVRSQKNISICVDALDEAIRPWEIASHLLKPLCGLNNVWLLIGTRPDSIQAHSRKRFRGAGDSTIEIDLDRDEYFDVSDTILYVKHRLLTDRERGIASPYASDSHSVEEAAIAIAKAAGKNFLVAKLTCDSLMRDPRPIAELLSWLSVLPSDVSTAFDEYLRRFDSISVPNWSKQKMVDLLEPLAYAQGQGLPRPLWPLFARALSGHQTYGDGDVRGVMEEAAPYILEPQEAGRTVYRLFHESFAEYLRTKSDFKDANRKIAKALLDEVGRDESGQRSGLKQIGIRARISRLTQPQREASMNWSRTYIFLSQRSRDLCAAWYRDALRCVPVVRVRYIRWRLTSLGQVSENGPAI